MLKKILATVVTAVVIGGAGVAVASAASPATSSSTTAKKSGPRAVAGLKLRKLAFDAAATTIGISPADLLQAMKGNHSIADVAQAHGVAEQKVVDATISAVDAKVQAAVSSGAITSDQAATIEKVAAKRVPKVIEATPRKLRREVLRAGATAVAAKTIGLTPQALRAAEASGQSVGAVATAHNVTPSTVVTALVTAGDARIDKAVANHHLTAARAAKMKARVPTVAQRFVDRTRGAKQPAAGTTAS
jgi:hypothetical protein